MDRALAEKISNAMAKATANEWAALNALLSQVEKDKNEAAQQWVATGELPALAPAAKATKKRKPLDLAAPYTSLVLNVPYARKEAAKAAGAKWHPTRKFWYFPAYENSLIPDEIKEYL